MSDDILKSLLATLSDDQKQKLMQSLLQSGDTAVEEPADEPSPMAVPRPKKKVTKTVVNDDFTVTRGNDLKDVQRQPVKAKQNQWKDVGEDRDEDFDPEKFEKLGKAQRRKVAPAKIDLECHVCGKAFKAAAGTVYGEYVRCNRCTGR
jgi:hypothetical protein